MFATQLHSLMTDAVDTLEGNKTSGECVWSKTEKVDISQSIKLYLGLMHNISDLYFGIH